MATMLRPNRNCCWVGQPDPTAWKKPTGDGCLGYARKPQYRLMRPSESADCRAPGRRRSYGTFIQSTQTLPVA